MKIKDKMLLVAVLFGAQSLLNAAEGGAGADEVKKSGTKRKVHSFSVGAVAAEARGLTQRLVGIDGLSEEQKAELSKGEFFCFVENKAKNAENASK